MLDVIKILSPFVASFVVGVLFTPLLTHYLYKYKVWKKTGGKIALNGKEAVEFNKLHAEKEEKTPRMGGIVVWFSVLFVSLSFWVLAKSFDDLHVIDFISRSQTWILLFALVLGAVVGFLSDLLDIGYEKRELKIFWRLALVASFSLFLAYWFYAKLGVSQISIPFGGYLELGVLFIPFVVALGLFLYASGVIDGIDGLSGGVFLFIFLAYSAIAMIQGQLDIAAFAASVAGALSAFLWFNIPPARFYMTETGTMALTMTLLALTFMTDKLADGKGLAVLPVVAFLLFATVFSNIIQVASKKIFGKKIFKIAPVHHHFEALGWPSYKVTMRYWVLGIIFALSGVLLSLI